MKQKTNYQTFASSWEKFAKQNSHALPRAEFINIAKTFGITLGNGLLTAYVNCGVIRRNKNGIILIQQPDWTKILYRAYKNSVDARRNKKHNKNPYMPFSWFVSQTYPMNVPYAKQRTFIAIQPPLTQSVGVVGSSLICSKLYSIIITYML